jgi:phosphoribosylformimino-5-aminoimidazole carboxamide ribotide isomerase
MQIIPAVDVLDGAVVRLSKGDYDTAVVYAADPVATATGFVDEGAELVHVVDLAGARAGTHDVQLWSRLGDAGIPFQVGGGIRDARRAAEAVDAGAQRVVVGTAAVWSPGARDEILAAVGPERLVAAVDVRAGRARGAGWTDEGRPVDIVAAELQAAGVLRALVTGIARDGMLSGPDLGVLATVARSAPGMALIGSGGVGSLVDLSALAVAGVEGVIVGRALYEGRFTVREAVAHMRET